MAGRTTSKRWILRLLGSGLLILTGLAIYLAATPLPLPENRFQRPRWIGPVQVVNVARGTILPNRALRIANGRIADIADAGALDAETRRSMMNAGGAYVVPGLWDMHALLIRYAPSMDYPLHLAHGVTRVRNILDCPAEGSLSLHPCRTEKARWNAAVGAGLLMGPMVAGSGTYPVNGPGQVHRDAPPDAAAATPDQARRLVRRFAPQLGARDHIKTYDGLPRASFFALADEARQHGIEVSGHIPVAVRTAEAAAAGFKAIAHARALPIACSAREDEILRLRTNKTPAAIWMQLALNSYDPAKCARLWSTLKARGTFISPTLITRFTETRAGIDALRADPDTRRFTPALIRLIQLEDIQAIEARKRDEEALYQRFYQASATRTADAARAGVRLLVGTDSYDVLVAPGVGLHHEIALWKRAGIPPADILRALTANAAAYFGLKASHGRIATGYAADLVFVGRNPLDDLTTLRRPRAVMQDGRLYTRETLDAALASSEEAAASWRFTAHFLRDLLRNPLGFAG